jgi:hypothetical protein
MKEEQRRSKRRPNHRPQATNKNQAGGEGQDQVDSIGVRREVAKGMGDGRLPPALRMGHH